MNAQTRRNYILSRLPLIDSGGPVWLNLPNDVQKRTKSSTKAKRLRRYNLVGRIDVRNDILHMIKLGLVKRERNGAFMPRRTYFVKTIPSENPKPSPAELVQEIESREQAVEERIEQMRRRIKAICDAIDERLGDDWKQKPENADLYSAVKFANYNDF